VTIQDLSCDLFPTFFEDRHRALGAQLREKLASAFHHDDKPPAVARALGKEHGLYAHLVPESRGGAKAGHPDDPSYVDVRALLTVREALGQVSPLADSIFAVQGLGSYPIALAGSDAQCASLLPEVLSGDRITGFGLTEPEAGSDVASMQTHAKRDGNDWLLTGSKTLISNAGIARHFIVFANADPEKGRKGITAFVVEADAPGLTVGTLPMSVPHPIGTLAMMDCRVSDNARLGPVGGGFKLAMQTLDAFRISVGAAANGMATAALQHSIFHVSKRKQFGAALATQQIVQAYLAEMATDLDAGRLLVARAAHLKDTRGGRVSVEAAMAKMFATEAAQRNIEKAVQLHGGMGVIEGTVVEGLYREIRPLRIYEGTTEIQKLIIAKGLLDRASQ